MKRLTNDEFIIKARLVHGNKYGYDKVKYQKAKIKITITCFIHGDFQQTASGHLNGGCKACGIEARVKAQTMSQEEFIKKAHLVHGDKYNYDKADYRGAYKTVIINCPLHGDFQQKATDHLNGGCQECAYDLMRERNLKRLNKSSLVFIEKARKVHGDKYHYNVKYKGGHTKIDITCPIHGDFKQTPAHHIHSERGCPQCGLEKMASQLRKTKEEFILDAVQIHGNKYDYCNVNYVNDSTYIQIGCVHHGDFFQSPSNHLRGNNCPFCTLTPQSKQELTITFELITLFPDINPKGFKTRVEGKLWSIDIYIPALHIGVEFDGSYWHKDKRALDKLKTKRLKSTGFNILRVREEPLKKISETDIISTQPFNAKEITNNILTHIMNSFELEDVLVKKMKAYISKKTLQNEKSLDEYIETILKEKAEKAAS